jgi:quercetin dioxygenase-like cupin family protein
MVKLTEYPLNIDHFGLKSYNMARRRLPRTSMDGVINPAHQSGNAIKAVVMNSDHLQPIHIPPGSGKVLNLLGVTHKLTSQHSGGAYYLFEFEFDPESGNSLHVHSYEDEVVYVLDGAIQIRLGNEKLQAVAGGVAHLPKHIPHALYNPLKVPSRYLGIAIPGGMEKFFDELSAAQEAGTLDDAMHKNISRKYGIEWLE